MKELSNLLTIVFLQLSFMFLNFFAVINYLLKRIDKSIATSILKNKIVEMNQQNVNAERNTAIKILASFDLKNRHLYSKLKIKKSLNFIDLMKN